MAGEIVQLIRLHGQIERGATGPDVRAVQLALRADGYGLKGTGIFGGATESAIEDFQRKTELLITGRFDEQTAIMLDSRLSVRSSRAERDNRPMWVIEAYRWIGTKEGPGSADNPVILEWAQNEKGEIAKEYHHDETAWCALFANMILTHCNLRGTKTLWALDFRDNWPDGVPLKGPAVGAFAPMERRNSRGQLIGGHITVVVGRDNNGNILGLGGNQSDSVNVARFPRSRMKWFQWPKAVGLPADQLYETLPLLSGQQSGKET